MIWSKGLLSESATVYYCLRGSSSLSALISSVHMDNINNIARLRFRNVLVLKASFSKNFQQIFDTNFLPTISQPSQFWDAHLPLSISLVDFETQTSLPIEAPPKKCASKQGPLNNLTPGLIFRILRYCTPTLSRTSRQWAKKSLNQPQSINLPCEPILSEHERKNIMERETMQHLWIDIFFPLFWSLQIKWCWSACWSALQQQEGLFENQGH